MRVVVCQENWVAELVEAYENGRITDHRWSVGHSVSPWYSGRANAIVLEFRYADSMVTRGIYDLRFFFPQGSRILVKRSPRSLGQDPRSLGQEAKNAVEDREERRN
jgi:hypothetical protein